jgi:hypothetical protein
LGCDSVRVNEGVFTPPKRFRREDFALLGAISEDLEVCIDDRRETLVECSFLLFRWPTVSLVGSTQDTSNIACVNLKESDLQSECEQVQDNYEG